MKELTIQQKARAYDEALHKAKRIINVCVDDNTECRSMIACIQQIFPELKEKEDDRKPNGGIVFEDFNEGDGFYKVNLAYLSKEQVEEIENIVKKWNPEPEESEDEKISKQIISFLKEFERDHYRNLDFSSWITWLEKQGEPTDINPSEFDLRLNKLLKQFETLPKEELASSLSFYLNVVQNNGTYKAEEKQGEKKPTDRVEPKFKVGDWVVRNGETLQISGIDTMLDGTFHYWFTKGTWLSSKKMENAILWTIQDAKDGDVLATGDWVFIFERLNTNDKPVCYCHYDIELGFAIDVNTYVSTVSTIKPATKEQRDTLMKAMADAGYTFDFEKKELKKIEDEEYDGEDYGIDSLFHAQRILEKTLGKVNGYQTDDGILEHKCAISAVKKLYEQKPDEWSEEDEDIRDTIIRDLKRLGGDIVNVKPAYKEEVGWLKSLEQRIGWKPIKEQMEALHDLNLTGGISYAGQGQVLIELYNDLKKL